MPVRERDPTHAVVDDKDGNGGNVVNEAEGVRLLYRREEDSPEENRYDYLKGEGCPVEENPPLPKHPWRVHILVIPHHRFLGLEEAVLSDPENGEEGVGGFVKKIPQFVK